MTTRRRWAVALGTVVLATGVFFASNAAAKPGDGQECRAAKGTVWLTPDGWDAQTGTGTIKGTIDGTFTYVNTAFATDNPWGPRQQSQLTVTPKRGPAVQLTMQTMGTNWTSQKVVAGGWIQGGRSGVDYYLSTSIVVGPNIPTQEWTYAGEVCTGQN